MCGDIITFIKYLIFSSCISVTWSGKSTPSFKDILPSYQEYGYASGRNGPSTWGGRFTACQGKRQSPVELVRSAEPVVARLPALRYEGFWDVSRVKDGIVIQNTWNSVEVSYPVEPPRVRGGPLKSDHVLSAINFHWGTELGSEHATDKYFYGMEMHMIFYKKQYGSILNASKESDGLAIVALFLMVAAQNNVALTSLVTALRAVSTGGSNSTLPDDSMDWMRRPLTDASYYTYQGSLTTPPCSEIVTWIVLDSPAYIGLKQIREFQRLKGQDGQTIEENRRPIQPLNGRQIFYVSI